MKLNDFLNHYTAILEEKGYESASLDVELLFCKVTGFTRIDLISNSTNEVDKKIKNKFEKLFKRRLKHEPIAYILGYKNFCGFDFAVNRNVLIPRPLTEEIVSCVIDDIEEKRSKVREEINIIDIGTGSGCIIISIAKNILNSCMNSRFLFFASDISKKALKVAKGNAKYFCVEENIKFLKGNLKIPNDRQFDYIIANLPYVDEKTIDYKNDNQKDLQFEPKLALFNKDKGFFLIRKLLNKIIKNNLLKDEGYVFLEVEKGQSERIRYEFDYYFKVEEAFDGRIVRLSKNVD